MLCSKLHCQKGFNFILSSETPGGSGFTTAPPPPYRQIQTSYEEEIKLKPFWQRSLLHEFFNITIEEDAVW